MRDAKYAAKPDARTLRQGRLMARETCSASGGIRTRLVMGRPLFIASAVALGLLFAGAAVASAEDPHVTDPEGDAREYNSEMAAEKAFASCRSVWPATQYGCGALRNAGVLPQWGSGSTGLVGGVPSSPALDVLAAWFEETPTHLLVHAQVASLDASLGGLRGDAPDPNRGGGSIVVRWHTGDDRCWEMVWIGDDAGGRLIGAYDNFFADCASGPEHPWGGACNAWRWCEYGVEHEIAFGSPATITWKVPRGSMLDGDAGATLEEPVVASYRGQANGQAWARIVSDVPGGSTSPVRHLRVETGSDFFYTVDISEPGRSFTFGLVQQDDPPLRDGRHWMDANPPNAAPRGDFLWYDVDETPERLTLKIGVGQVDETPGDAWFWGTLGLSTGHVVNLWIDNSGESGTWSGYAAYDMPYYDRLFAAYSIVVPAVVDVVPGIPGEIHLTLDRSTLPFIGAGTETTLLVGKVGASGDAFTPDAHGTPANPLLDPHAEVIAGPFQRHPSEYNPLPPYRFLHDTPLAALEGVVRLEDDVGDAKLPELAARTGGNADQFDITYLEARAVGKDTLHMTVGIRDLSTVAVPLGYHAVFYSFGLETDAGAYMVGYYKDGESPAGTFLCAHDTTVLAEAPRDPTQGVWTILTGLVTTAGGADGSGSGGPGSITVHLPYACIGATEGEDVTLRRFDAGTYLIQNPTGRNAQGTAILVDEARAPSAVVVRLPVEVATPPVWFDAPFGIQNFWDMLGIGLAAVVATGGAALRLRRRSRDKRAIQEAKVREDREAYKAALGRAVAAGDVADPQTDAVLQALRRRLGISEREHAVLELEARAAAGIGVTGLASGSRFLGKYRIEKLLGEGTFARTYLARDEKLARRVVLKVARWESEKEMKRALHEGGILASLDHPNVVKVHDVDEVAGQVVLVLEHVGGGSLAEVLRGGKLPTAAALTVADGVLAALEAAHARGVVHRDVKPENILFAAPGAAGERRADPPDGLFPKLCDFGIARTESGSGTVTGATLAGNAAGTVAYMAPEQARGAPGGPRSDLYSVGAVLYQMLEGRPYLEFDGLREFEARAAVQETPARLPIAGVPDAVNAVLAQALEKDPARRPKDAAEMRRALAAAGK